MEWVEVRGRTVDVAVAAALEELGLESPEQAVIEVIQEPQRGFLGIGGKDALVRVRRKPKSRRRRGKGRGKGGQSRERGGNRSEGRGRGAAGDRNTDGSAGEGARTGAGRSGGGRGAGGGRNGGGRNGGGRNGGGRNGGGREGRSSEGRGRRAPAASEDRPDEGAAVDREEQAKIVEGFLSGLLDALGLEGEVVVSATEDAVVADVRGDQTEALVGPRGSVMQAVQELSRTIVHRRTQAPVRLRLDIAGYGERRREALRIYAARLAEQVKEEGSEIMLEPMNAADRKVIHDAIAEIEGVRSYSEGEEPRRSVVISPAD